MIERDSTWTHPVAKIVPHPITVHGDTRIDNYFWMRDRESPDMLACLEAENAYQTAMMEPTVALQGQLYDEILGRIQEDDQSVPMRIDDWFYYGRTEKGKAYGPITAKTFAVLEALLWCFHNARSGLCFPSYETIAKAAGCARSTVAEAIKALEDAGLLTWVNRIVRVRERCEDLFGHMGSRWRIIRTSNAYEFRDPLPGGGGQGAAMSGLYSKSEFRSGTSNQHSLSALVPPPPPLNPELAAALSSWRAAYDRKNGLN